MEGRGDERSEGREGRLGIKKTKEGGESGKSPCSDSTAEISVSDECVSIRVCLK